MPLPEINYSYAQGGLGQQAPGTDYYSGLVFWCADNKLPSGFSTTDRIKAVSQIEDAEALGILADYNDETPATGTYLVTAAGATNDVAVFKVTETDGTIVTIGTYTRGSGDTTAALVATGIAAAINLLTPSTGYSASVSTATVTITARKGLGVFLNSGTPITVTITGTVAGTLTQFSGGVASVQAPWHYHLTEFFKRQANNQGKVWIMINTTPGGAYDFTELTTLQQFTNGQIKQMGVFITSIAYSSAHFATIQAIVNTNTTNHMPIDVVCYSADMSAMTAAGIALDLGTLSDKNVSVSIGQDGAALGALLFKTTGKSIGCVGAMLGTIAASAVSQSISEVGAFNVSDDVEFDTAAFATGELVRNVSITVQNQLHDWGYVFLRKFMGTTTITGTYFNSSRTAIAITSDYCYIERNRTINKAVRGTREAFLPLLSSRIYLNSNGTIRTTDIANYQAKGGEPLGRMQADGDLSGDAGNKGYAIVIDPTQNVLGTGILYITIKLLPVAIGRQINVKIGYVPKIS